MVCNVAGVSGTVRSTVLHRNGTGELGSRVEPDGLKTAPIENREKPRRNWRPQFFHLSGTRKMFAGPKIKGGKEREE